MQRGTTNPAAQKHVRQPFPTPYSLLPLLKLMDYFCQPELGGRIGLYNTQLNRLDNADSVAFSFPLERLPLPVTLH